MSKEDPRKFLFRCMPPEERRDRVRIFMDTRRALQLLRHIVECTATQLLDPDRDGFPVVVWLYGQMEDEGPR